MALCTFLTVLLNKKELKYLAKLNIELGLLKVRTQLAYFFMLQSKYEVAFMCQKSRKSTRAQYELR